MRRILAAACTAGAAITMALIPAGVANADPIVGVPDIQTNWPLCVSATTSGENVGTNEIDGACLVGPQDIGCDAWEVDLGEDGDTVTVRYGSPSCG